MMSSYSFGNFNLRGVTLAQQFGPNCGVHSHKVVF